MKIQRRKFVKYVSVGSGVFLAGMSRLVMGKDHPQKLASEMRGSINIIPGKNYTGTEKASCRLIPYNGKPTVHVNGKPYFPLAYLSYFPEQFRYKNMRESGIRFFSLSITLGDRWLGGRKSKVRHDKYNIWYAPEKIDFEIFDSCINEILDVAPDAYIFPRIFCDSPSWWDSYHPAETSRTYKEGLPQGHSFSSLIWRSETAEVLRKIVRHVYQSPYADRFIGIHITAGGTEEAVHHGAWDCSIAAQKKFKKWILNRYNNDVNLIQKHFKRRIDEISIPSPEEDRKAEFGDFFDPEKSRLAIDYRIFKAVEIVESFDFLCKAVKEESNGNMLTGMFYGHTFAQWLDHMAFSLMLKSPHIDFFSSTTIGTEIDSMIKANKIFYNEGDERTCLSKWISDIRPEIDPYREYIEPGWVRPNETLEQSMEHLKSEFSHTICTNSIIWWFDLWGGWYDHERILNLFSEMQKVGDESIHLLRNSVSQVCVIVDEKSFPYFAVLRRGGTTDIQWVGMQKVQIDKMGAPYDIYLFDDLKDLDISKYKMMIFFNSFLLDELQRRMIHAKCMRDNRVLLWFYAPGLISDKISLDNISTLVNMEIGSETARAESETDVKMPGQDLKYKGSKVSPFLFIKGGASKIYGYSKEGHSVLAEKKEKYCTNVLGCLPPVPWQVIQYFARKAGVHIYSDSGDFVLANESYLSVRAASRGKRLIKLPGKSRLLEILDSDNEFKTDESKVSKQVKEIEVEFPEPGRVKFFQVIQKKDDKNLIEKQR